MSDGVWVVLDLGRATIRRAGRVTLELVTIAVVGSGKVAEAHYAGLTSV